MTITRFDTGPLMSQAVVHGGIVYTAGQVAEGAKGESITSQTRDVLARIDGLLERAGADKSTLIAATIWLSDMAYYSEMNEVWKAWVVPGQTPARVCVESKLASDQFDIEIAVIAAV